MKLIFLAFALAQCITFTYSTETAAAEDIFVQNDSPMEESNDQTFRSASEERKITFPKNAVQNMLKKLIQPTTVTTTKYVHATVIEKYHPVCYINPKKKPPCVNAKSKGTTPKAVNYDEFKIEPTTTFRIHHTDMPQLKRDARYITFHPQPIDKANSEEKPTEYLTKVEGSEDYKVDGNPTMPTEEADFLKVLKPIPVQTVTKTLTVTRVIKKYYGLVTATLVARNCAPSTPDLPHCARKFKPFIVHDELPDGAYASDSVAAEFQVSNNSTEDASKEQ